MDLAEMAERLEQELVDMAEADALHQQQERLFMDSLLDGYVGDRSWEGDFFAYPSVYFGSGDTELVADQIILPMRTLNELIAVVSIGIALVRRSDESSVNRGADFPFLFLASNPQVPANPITCRVLEFTAPEDFCFMANELLEALCLDGGGALHLQHVTLPKGSYVKLKPDADNQFLRWSNPKAVFETALRRFATLTLGSTICLPHNGEDYRFTVTELKPSETVCILNTDMEVDFDASLLPPTLPSIEELTKNLVIGDTRAHESDDVASPPANRKKKEEPEKEAKGGFVAFGGSGHSLSSTEDSSSSVTEGKKEGLPQSPHKSPTNPSKESLGGSVGRSSVLEEEPLEEGFVRCELCRRGVPERNMARHEAFCARNNARCEHCGDVMAKSKLDAHVEEKHRIMPCPQCDEQVESGLLEEHMKTTCMVPCLNCSERIARGRMDEHLAKECIGACKQCGEMVQLCLMAKHLEEACSKRLVQCEFCELRFTADSVMEHGDMCGSRTEKCPKCDQWVMLKHMSVHEALDCELDTHADELRASAPTSFCEFCNQPCYSVDQLQEHLSSQLGVLLGLVASGIDNGLARNQFAEVLMHYEVIKADWEASPDTAAQVVAGIIASCKHASVVEKLLEAQLIDLDACYLGKPLLFHFLLKNCPSDVFSVLLDHHPDMTATDASGKGILHLVTCDEVKPEILTTIVQQLPLALLHRSIAPDDMGATPLGLALSSGLPQHTIPLLLYGGYTVGEVTAMVADRRQWIGLKKGLVLSFHKLYFGVNMEEAEQRTRAADLEPLLSVLSSGQLAEVNDALLEMLRRSSDDGRAPVGVTAMPQRLSLSNNNPKGTVHIANCGSRSVQVWANDSSLPISLKMPGEINSDGHAPVELEKTGSTEGPLVIFFEVFTEEMKESPVQFVPLVVDL